MVDHGAGLAHLRGFMLYRRRDIKRMFAYSSIEHMGIIAFAFGMGGPLANFAGLLHMTMHSLTKSAIFFAVGHIAQVKGTQRIADMGGLTETHPVLGWGLVLGVVAIAGLPPLGIFMSEFLVVTSTFARAAAARDPAGVRAAGRPSARCSCGCNGIAFGEPRGATAPVEGLLRADVRPSRAGVHAPGSICRRRWSPGSSTSRSCWDRRACLRRSTSSKAAGSPAHRPWPRVRRRARRLARASPAQMSRPAVGRLLGLWGDAGAVHMAVLDERAGDIAVATSNARDGQFPSVGAHASAGDPPGARHPRPLRARAGGLAGHAALARPRLLGRAPSARRAAASHAGRAAAMPFCRPRAKACTRSRSGRCMPASSSPAISASPPTARPWCGSSSGSATSHKGIESLMARRDARQAARLAGRTSGDSTVAYALAFARAVEAALDIERPAARASICAR